MVRRHRIVDSELKWVARAACLQLMALRRFFDSEGVGEEAVALFRFLWRITRHSSGKPGYPGVSVEAIDVFLEEYAGGLVSV